MMVALAPHLTHLRLSSSVLPATMPPHPATVALSRRGGCRDPGARLPTREPMTTDINNEQCGTCRLVAIRRHGNCRQQRPKQHLSRHCHKTSPQLERGSLFLYGRGTLSLYMGTCTFARKLRHELGVYTLDPDEHHATETSHYIHSRNRNVRIYAIRCTLAAEIG